MINTPAVDKQGNPTGSRKHDRLFLLLNSTGGSLDDGFALYNLIRLYEAFKIEVVTVNMGMVASVANVIFMAGARRIATPHSFFHFHNFEWALPAQNFTREKFDDVTRILDMSRTLNLDLLKERTALTDADFDSLKLLDSPVVRDASFAKEKGIVQEIGFPDIPVDTIIYNVEY
jgi:ATP-dependent protease ClpP protease subunit